MQVFQATLAQAIEAEDVAPLTAALQRLQVSLITSGVGAAA